MINLKPAYDALVTQYENVQRVATAIEERFAASDIDGALELEPELNQAQAKADAIGALYQNLVSIGDNDAARYFVPASDQVPDADKPKPLTRAEFDRMAPAEKATYVGQGGKIQDEE